MKGSQVKIADFGVAKQMLPSDTQVAVVGGGGAALPQGPLPSRQQTATAAAAAAAFSGDSGDLHTQVGTAGFQPREVMEGAPRVRLFAADCFSLGVVLHFVLTRRHPFSPNIRSGDRNNHNNDNINNRNGGSTEDHMYDVEGEEEGEEEKDDAADIEGGRDGDGHGTPRAWHSRILHRFARSGKDRACIQKDMLDPRALELIHELLQDDPTQRPLDAGECLQHAFFQEPTRDDGATSLALLTIDIAEVLGVSGADEMCLLGSDGMRCYVECCAWCTWLAGLVRKV